MSRLEGKKGFSCISNCLPMKGRSKTTVDKLKAKVSVPDYGTSMLDINDSYFNGDNGKLAQTRQWLQNLSTVANYEPNSVLDDSELSRLGREQPQKRPCSCCRDKTFMKHNDTGDSVSDGKSHHCNSYMSDNKRKACDDSCLSDIKGRFNESSILSSKMCDSSALSSKCCSQHKHRRRKGASSTLRNPETSSIMSGSSSVSLATELVTLNMDECKHLGITIVGHSNSQGDCGIFVGSVKKDGAAAFSGRIEPGDLILEVNGIDLERMTNEHALIVLKTELAKGGMVQVLLAKYWDMDADDDAENRCYNEPLYEAAGSVHSAAAAASVCSSHHMYPPARPLDCGFQRINALRSIPEDARLRQFYEASGMSASEMEKQSLARASLQMPITTNPHPSLFGNGKTGSSSSSSVHTNYPDSGYHEPRPTGFAPFPMALPGMFTIPSQGSTIDRRLQAAAAASDGKLIMGDSGKPFLGVDLINWIRGQATNLTDRKEAQLYAQNLLQSGYICNADVRQSGLFHEQNYYVFGQNSNRGVKRTL